TDDAKVLQEWKRVLHSGGRLFLSVPAYQGLFGPHDRALGHLRRYNLPQLKKILQNNGFTVVFSSYFFCLTFPAFLAQRFWVRNISTQNNPSPSMRGVAQPPLTKGRSPTQSGLRPGGRGGVVQNNTVRKSSSDDKSQYVDVPKWLNNFLIGFGEIESWWLSFSKFVFGSSIVVLAKKNE
ncbi:hypothetical protein KJ836_02520, partial [Patescibacteria group bacterium]|nr:hypothetical protein [Patescibacteria group bacterium]